MSADPRLADATKTMQEAECLHDADAVSGALDQMAAQITRDLGERNPLVLIVMNGGMIPASFLLKRLSFPLKIDYLHASRYREDTEGNELLWQHAPHQNIRGRHLLIIDDILDEGHTLAAIQQCCQAQAPASISTAVLVQKEHDRGVRPPLEYIGLTVPDRYVFGMGMDYKGYWRNVDAIYAVRD